MSSTNAPNASGLTPNESKTLNERSPAPEEQRIINAIKELYACKPQESSYDIYAPNAIFHDPIGYAKGLDSVKSQFNSLPKLFTKSEITKFRLLANPSKVPESTLLIDQDVHYYVKSTVKPVNSLLTLERNAEGLVTKHTEEWDHKRESTGEDGFLGMLNEFRKKMTAGMTEKLVSKDPPEVKP